MVALSVSAHGSSGMIAVGLIEPGALLPCDVRVVDFEVAELVADGITQRLGSAAICGRSVAIDLDELVSNAERILARRRS